MTDNPQVEPLPRANTIALTMSLAGVIGVWLGGDVWSFNEQARLATLLAFSVPPLLPLVLDGFAASLAGVAFAASLDGRPAVGARLGTLLAVVASSVSNAVGAWIRTSGTDQTIAVTIAAGIPVAANLAWEVVLGEVRKQVSRKRGLKPPKAAPAPRMVRFFLSPFREPKVWRATTLALTDPAPLAVTAALDDHQAPRQDARIEIEAPTQVPAIAPQTAETESAAVVTTPTRPHPADTAPAAAKTDHATRTGTADMIRAMRLSEPGVTQAQVAQRISKDRRTVQRNWGPKLLVAGDGRRAAGES